MAAGGEGPARAEGEGATGGFTSLPAQEEEPGRGQLFNTVVDAFLEKLVAAGSYQRFANCYHRFYKLQPEMTRSIYDQFISQLQTSIQEEIREIKKEGNLEDLFASMDRIVEEAKNREEPAWRPSGIPEEDLHSAMVPYLLKHQTYLRRALKEKEEENRKLAEAVLAGRERISEMQQQIQNRKQAWQLLGPAESGEDETVPVMARRTWKTSSSVTYSCSDP